MKIKATYSDMTMEIEIEDDEIRKVAELIVGNLIAHTIITGDPLRFAGPGYVAPGASWWGVGGGGSGGRFTVGEAYQKATETVVVDCVGGGGPGPGIYKSELSAEEVNKRAAGATAGEGGKVALRERVAELESALRSAANAIEDIPAGEYVHLKEIAKAMRTIPGEEKPEASELGTIVARWRNVEVAPGVYKRMLVEEPTASAEGGE